jgi:hypothetical protein
MCLIVEHARLIKENEELRQQVSVLQPMPVLPITGSVEVSRDEFLGILAGYDVLPISYNDPLDPVYYLNQKSELDRIAPGLVYPADWYVVGWWDCEDYGLQGQLDAGKLRCCARLATGYMPLGYHGWILALDLDARLWVLEPNAGFPWAGQWFEPHIPGEFDYDPKKVFA